MRVSRSVQLLAVMLATCAVPVRAQDSTPRGFLFGAGGNDVNSRNSLSLSLDMSASSISDSGVATQAPVGNADFLVDGFTSQWLGTADYARSRRRTQLQASAVTSFRYSSSLGRVSPISDSGNLSWAIRLPWRSVLRLGSGVAYAPAYLYELFPVGSSADAAQTITANPDYRILQANSSTYAGRASFNVGAVTTPHVSASVGFARTEFAQDVVTQPNLSTTEARVQFTDPVSSSTGWSIEYAHSTATYGIDGVTDEDRISASVEYSYAVSRSRRLRFRLNVGPGILHMPASSVFASLSSLELPPDQSATGQNIRISQLETDASVEGDFGRRVHGSINYRRGVEYVALLSEPVSENAVYFEVGGLITRRIDWLTSAGYATGATVLNVSAEGLTTNTEEVRMRYALSRSVAVYAEYLHYSYDFKDQIGIAPGLPNVFNRNEIRFGGMLIVRPIHTSSRGRGR